MADPIRLIVGLGNPGAEYENTRHNAGFWLVERLARQEGITLSPDKNSSDSLAKDALAVRNAISLCQRPL